MSNIVWSPAFTRQLKRLIRQNPQIRPLVEQILQQLTEDPFHLSLRTHKLRGELSCSIDYNNRIVFYSLKIKSQEKKKFYC